MPYRTPFITETDEPKFTDCQCCTGLMLVADWTDEYCDLTLDKLVEVLGAEQVAGNALSVEVAHG